MTPAAPRPWNLLLLAVCIVLPRLIYLLASVSDDEVLRSAAWLVDVGCLIGAALLMLPPQRDFGAEDTLGWARLGSAGFALDGVTTLFSRFFDMPWLLVLIAVIAWISGLTRWVAELCQRFGATYFVYRLWIVAMVTSYVVRFLQPEWQVSGFTFTVLMIGIGVQLTLLAVAIRDHDDDDKKKDILPV